MTDSPSIATYQECLELLTEAARNGNVQATVQLERVLRPASMEEIDDALDRLLAED